MRTNLKNTINSIYLADLLGLQIIGQPIDINKISSIKNPSAFSLTFSKKVVSSLSSEKVVIITEKIGDDENLTYIISPTPRLDFVRALKLIDFEAGFEEFANEPIIPPSVKVGNNTYIGKGVIIGEGTIIGNNVVIYEGVSIGKNCIIKSNTVIGEDGFGFERDENSIPIRMKHLGSVFIGNNVEIGSLSTVCRGTIEDTWIGDNVKIDDHVHIGHNCKIEENCILTACVNLGGGTIIRKNAWLGLNSTTIEKIEIGENATIGIGAVVLKKVNDNETVFGNPARKISN